MSRLDLSSRWRVAGASIIGTAHVHGSLPCQDAHSISTVAFHRSEYLISVCSDGAGSASHSHEGAVEACRVGQLLAADHVEKSGMSGISAAVVRDWCLKIRNALELLAQELNVEICDLHCTFLLAIIGPEECAFAQIGDGGMIIDGEERLNIVFWPQSGEYANTTNFITSESSIQMLDFAVFSSPVTRFAAFTDGIERLALVFSDRTVHQPFFDPLFEALNSKCAIAEYQQRLEGFLDSIAVNSRTDDDKTLIVGHRTRPASIWDFLPTTLRIPFRRDATKNPD